jgi:hypothetical protein
MVSGVIRLGEVAARIALLQVACNQCPRAGQLRTDRLLVNQGADLPIPRLRELLAADPYACTFRSFRRGSGKGGAVPVEERNRSERYWQSTRPMVA